MCATVLVIGCGDGVGAALSVDGGARDAGPCGTSAPADAGPPPFAGEPTLSMGIGCSFSVHTFEELSDGDVVTLEPSLQGGARHIDVGVRGANLSTEPPPDCPGAGPWDWVGLRATTTFRLLDGEGRTMAQARSNTRLYPIPGGGPHERVAVSRLVIADELVPRVLSDPVSLEVERDEGATSLSDRVDDVSVVSGKRPCF